MNLKYKKMVIFIYLLFISIILTSCINVASREIDELGIVLTTAIDMDMENEEVILIHEVIIPEPKGSPSNKNESKVVYVQSRGITVFDAIRNATLLFDRKLFLAHNRIIILGDDFARRGIGDFINFYTYDSEPRESAYIVVAKESKASEILGINSGMSNVPGDYLFSILKNHEYNSKSRIFPMKSYMKYFFQKQNPVSSLVQVVRNPSIKHDGEVKSSVDSLDVSGGAVFNKDKLIGYFNAEETMGYNFLINEFENGIIVFETQDELNKETKQLAKIGNYTVVEVKSSKTKKNIEIVDGMFHLIIDVDIKGTMGENTQGLVLMDRKVLESVELFCSNKVKEYITSTMEKSLNEFKVDSFSVGNLVHIQYPDLWRNIQEDWESIFPELTYTINVKTNLIGTGLLNTPVNIKKERENR